MQQVDNTIACSEKGAAEALQIGNGAIHRGCGDNLAGFKISSQNECALVAEFQNLFKQYGVDLFRPFGLKQA